MPRTTIDQSCDGGAEYRDQHPWRLLHRSRGAFSHLTTQARKRHDMGPDGNSTFVTVASHCHFGQPRCPLASPDATQRLQERRTTDLTVLSIGYPDFNYNKEHISNTS
ncbi:hypothetical protein CDV36_004633 [Fusarium kuroshium]|uniref:Uncharacterized protein n=1 Tax=Fusarium kuroshium TaxID=2010991 RepID=A0A3M2SDR2_9HYPO|nr:hypothetical protein CDV36_004633 [Fusarium kuroshium]